MEKNYSSNNLKLTSSEKVSGMLCGEWLEEDFSVKTDQGPIVLFC